MNEYVIYEKSLTYYTDAFASSYCACPTKSCTYGNFEQYTTCPTASNQMSNSTGWSSWTNASPDYFNACASGSSGVGIPTNIGTRGYQYPHSGNGSAGIIIEINHPTNAPREYFGRAITAMQAGLTYEVSLSINSMNDNNRAIDDIEVFFFDAGPTFVNTTFNVPVSSQVDFSGNGVFADTLNWTRLVKTYTADSAYDNIVIGGFKPPSAIQSTNNGTNTGWLYYYIDSVVVKYVGRSDINYRDSILCAKDTIRVPYRVNHSAYFQNNNVFSIQLSNASGSFASPVTIGTKTSKVSDTIVCVIPAGTTAGTGYRIRMVASNGADTSEDNGINIKIGNTTGFAGTTNSPVCSGNTLTVNASSVTGGVYAWTGPNSFSSTTANNSFTNAGTNLSGDYYITIQQYGCAFKDTVTATVNPTPVAPVANSNTPLCAGQTLNLAAATSTSGVSWGWTGPGTYTSTTQNPNITNSTTAMSGDYIVTATLGNCTAKDTATVLVKPSPAAVTTSNNSPVCVGDSLKIFSTTSTTGVTYIWAGPNSFSATTQNASIANSTVAATGWYRMTVDLNGCTYKDSSFATVNVIQATPTVSYNNPLCIGESLSLTASTVTGATYNWNGPNNFTSNQQNPNRANMQFGDTGIYSVTTSMNGCTSPAANVSVKINPLPFVVIIANPGDSICNGAPVLFTAYPNNHGGTPTYQWFVNGTPSGTGTVFNGVSLANGNIVRCDMTENTKCSVPITDQSNDIEMKVLPWLAPTVSISANPPAPWDDNVLVSFTATPTNGGNNPGYQWRRNGTNVQGATNAVWGVNVNQLSKNDKICVLLKSNYKCPQPDTALSNCINTQYTGVNNIERGALKLYPNPVSNQLFISGIGNASVIELYDVVGRKYSISEWLNYSKGIVTIGVSSLASGVYIIKLSDEGVQYIQRFVKE